MEIEKFLKIVFRDHEKQDTLDLEALEYATRDVMLKCGAIILEQLLTLEDGASLEPECECSGKFLNKTKQSKNIRSILGPVRLMRNRQQCNCCKTWRVPQDIILDVVKTGFSPGLRRMMAKTGADLCFDKTRDKIHELAGIRITDKDAERIAEAIGEDMGCKEDEEVRAAMAGEEIDAAEAPKILYIATDGTGIPVLRRETKGRKGKAKDGIARTREVKLGAIFTQTTTDEAGKAIRDPCSTSYVGKIESAEVFGSRLYTESLKRGLNKAEQVVVLGDGAPWIWNLADLHFPDAIQIVDFYHAKEHLGDLSKILFPKDKEKRDEWMNKASDLLWDGDISALLHMLENEDVKVKKRDEANKTANYIEKNKARMRYGEFRRMGLFIGSGVIEAGCRSVIGQRLKCSGMHWSIRGANAIIALRCCLESGTFEDYWESRLAA